MAIELSNTLSPANPNLWVYTFFVINFTTLLFIVGMYGFAYKFLGDNFYIPLATGWLVNAIYIALETILMVTGVDESFTLGVVTFVLGLLSMPFFHMAVRLSPLRREARGRVSLQLFAVGLGVAAGCVVCLFGLRPLVGENVAFIIVSVPATLYTVWVLLAVAVLFFRLFPESDYGLNSRLLHGAWAGYAVIQFFYPLKYVYYPANALGQHIPIYERPLMVILFFTAFSVKVLGSWALLNLLRESYAAAQAEIRAASVLADIGDAAAGLHHDIANPLSWIGSELRLLGQQRGSDRIVAQFINNVRAPLGLIDTAIKFVEFIRGDTQAIAENFRRINAKEPISFSVGLFKKRFSSAVMRIVQPPKEAGDYFIRANRDLLAEAFANILNNAHEAGAKVVRIGVRRVFDDEPAVVFTFWNDGRPLTEEELQNCFQPGWSSKEKGANKANTGMGLYMCSKIISIHRGEVTIDNVENGVEVKAVLPFAKMVPGKSRNKGAQP